MKEVKKPYFLAIEEERDCKFIAFLASFVIMLVIIIVIYFTSAMDAVLECKDY